MDIVCDCLLGLQFVLTESNVWNALSRSLGDTKPAPRQPGKVFAGQADSDRRTVIHGNAVVDRWCSRQSVSVSTQLLENKVSRVFLVQILSWLWLTTEYRHGTARRPYIFTALAHNFMVLQCLPICVLLLASLWPSSSSSSRRRAISEYGRVRVAERAHS